MDGTYRVTLPYAVAGVVVRNGKVVEAAPILKWTVGKTIVWLRFWAGQKGGTVEEIPVRDIATDPRPA